MTEFKYEATKEICNAFDKANIHYMVSNEAGDECVRLPIRIRCGPTLTAELSVTGDDGHVLIRPVTMAHSIPDHVREIVLLFLNTFKVAVKANPDAHPLFHSERGFQYTNRTFHYMLKEAGMTQSMSRVAHCIDNGPMEGFWGILKREKYYGKRFTSKKELVRMIRDYIYYYNTQRVQRNLGVVTPMEKFQMAFAA